VAYKTQVLAQIARMYYEQGKTQGEIAATLGYSRIQITRMLTAARERGVVQIHIIDERGSGSIQSMAREIELRFNLKKMLIVPNNPTVEYDFISEIAHAGAQFLDSTLQNGQIVGVGWGMAVTAMTESFSSNQKKDILFIPALGGINEKERIYNLSDILKQLSERAGGMYNPLYAPVIIDNKELRDALLNESSIQSICRLWRQLDVLIVGIGGMRTKMPYALRDYLIKHELSLKNLHITCDICFNFFNETGELVRSKFEDRTINIQYEDIKRTPMTIAVAGGKSKVYAIYAALLSGCLDVLVSDINTCRDLLSLTSMY